MNHIVVRYGELGTKSDSVRGRMVNVLRQRVVDRLEYERISFRKVRTAPGRIIVEGVEDSVKASRMISELPGVSSTSPTVRTDPFIDDIIREASDFEVGDSFGIDASRSGNHNFDSMDINVKAGEAVEDSSEASVDLDNPDTWINIDVRDEEAFIFTQRFEGSGGMPVGSSGTLAGLISGGIDSPVAAYRMMTRGCDIHPIYFYNRPFSAEDHVLRFEAVLKKLVRFHPGKKWSYTRVDMKDVNEELMEIGRGRMVLHRYVMFRIADEIASEKGFQGLVTGESLSQKSSQTASNMALTSQASILPIHRPLIAESKESITEKARELDTFTESSIDSACRNISPDNPATEMSENDFKQLKQRIDIERKVEEAVENAEEKVLTE